MPTVSEISLGSTFERSAERDTVADQSNRVFRVITDVPGASVDVQTLCGVKIGDVHPSNPNIFCSSFGVQYDGDSRVVLLCTFNYRSEAAASGDPQNQEPGTRAANWTTSTSLIDTPVYAWRPRLSESEWGATLLPAVNPAGDMYDGIAQLTGMVNISITQEFSTDPTTFNQYSGYINDEEITLGSLVMAPHTVMFRGVQSQPYVETWGNIFFRGWRSTYEFAYKKNQTKIAVPGPANTFTEIPVDLGWDIAVPASGFNVKAFDPNAPNNDDDVFGQPLRHGDAQSADANMRQYAGVVIPPAGGGYLLPASVSAGDRVPAMVKVFSYENGDKGCSQARASSPIPLNPDGRPRKESATPKVLVYGYQVQPSINFTQTLALRLL